MNGANERDEMLERLWQLRERGCSTVPALRGELADRYREVDLAELSRDSLVVLAGEEISLTAAGS
ncbi:MAG TPA: hypothetical protein VFB30_04285, partial [Spirochaetia bacterium]|nr:hypothetical protein [Spirochaetia bacterium]